MLKLIKTWHKSPDGKDVLASQYSIEESGRLSGECRTWNTSGELETSCVFVDGIVVGKKSFYKDGRIVKEIDYDFDGCPFVIKFFADEKTEERVKVLGLAAGLEGLTLNALLDSFEKLRQERDDLVAKSQVSSRARNVGMSSEYDKSNKVLFT